MTNSVPTAATPTPARRAGFLNRRRAWLLLLSAALVALASVVIPAWLIQPFRTQSARGLEVSYMLRGWSPLGTLVLSIVAFGLMLWLWRGARRWTKPVLVVVFASTLLAAWFARQNHFEWMFNPLARSAYAGVAEADFVAGSDMVLAVEKNGEAVAYPVRQMAYHHLAHDTVGGTPVVATY